MKWQSRRDGRVVEGATLEMWWWATIRGFESLSLRHFFCQKNGERRRKSSLHCAKHNFTQKAQPFLHIFTKPRRRLTCLSAVALCEGGWRRFIPLTLHFTCEEVGLRHPWSCRLSAGGCVIFYCASLTRRQAALIFIFVKKMANEAALVTA